VQAVSELRLNLVTRAWVIIAKERAKRPEDFKRVKAGKSLPERLDTCPFCPGNEDKTPRESFRLDGKDGWKIRVVDNKFPALSNLGERRRVREGSKRLVSGVGVHDVIIETPLHNQSPALMELEDVADIISIYRNRFLDAYSDPRVEHVIVFRNHGERAGTSLEHPHSQLIATPVVPVQFRDRIEAAMHYFDDTGECLMCDLVKSEMEEGTRIVHDTEHFITFEPYAAVSPFHTWIFPKRHSASFSRITEDEIKDLALHLKTLLSKFYHGVRHTLEQAKGRGKRVLPLVPERRTAAHQDGRVRTGKRHVHKHERAGGVCGIPEVRIHVVNRHNRGLRWRNAETRSPRWTS
jgi:UDPglucose--hexose-1-phosphate uridylyltransferase